MRIVLNPPHSFMLLGGRQNQEDARFPDCDTPSAEQMYYVVCDGVGGQAKGEIASRTVSEAIGRYMARVNLHMPFRADDFRRVLEYAYSRLFRVMYKYDARDMATTLVFACFHEEGVSVAHIGDSRVYHIRPRAGILYRSYDHSLVNAMVRSGNMTPQEAVGHKQGNYITRCMCYPEQSQPLAAADLMHITDVEAGDYFLLCTDGVTGMIDDKQIVDILGQHVSDREKMEQMARLTDGSHDNCTATLIRVRDVLCRSQQPSADSSSHDDAGDNTLAFDTVMLTNAPKGITEVEPHVSQTLWTRISNFFYKYL